jgi:hypothetical protein
MRKAMLWGSLLSGVSQAKELSRPFKPARRQEGPASLWAYDPEIARINGWSLSVKLTELTLLSVRTAVVPTVGS